MLRMVPLPAVSRQGRIGAALSSPAERGRGDRRKAGGGASGGSGCLDPVLARMVSAWACFHPLAQIRDQPAAGAAGNAAALMYDIERQRDLLLAHDRELLQPAGRDMAGDHVAGHVAPAEAGEQEIEAGGEVREPPQVTADDPA